MSATKPTAARARQAPARKPARILPPVSPARFEEALGLVEQMVGENYDEFVSRGQEVRRQHRDGSERPLSALEAAQVAAGMMSAQDLPPITVAVAIQQSDLRATDEPEASEILLRGGVATAPAFVGLVQRFVALIEMPADEFRDAREAGRLNLAIDAAVKRTQYEPLSGADGGRQRAIEAFDHFSLEVASTPGKVLGLLARKLWESMQQAITDLGLQRGPSSLTGSPPSTDGLAATSSTTSATPTP